MKKLAIDLKNCHGIKRIKHDFDFSSNRVYAIYAPNGSMKSSLAKTFDDMANAIESKDHIFRDRESHCIIKDDNDIQVPKENIFVIRNYAKEFTHFNKTSTLLVDSKLKSEYKQLYIAIEDAKKRFLRSIKDSSGSKKNLEVEISEVFTGRKDSIYDAILKIEPQIKDDINTIFDDIPYDKIFDDKVLSLLSNNKFMNAVKKYVQKYNELIDESPYLRRGIFDHNNAAVVAKDLSSNGFFKAKHTINLSDENSVICNISTKEEFEQLIAKQKTDILNNNELINTFNEIDDLISKTISSRAFRDFIARRVELIPYLEDIDNFKKEILCNYIKHNNIYYNHLLEELKNSELRRDAIEQAASNQKTQWENVVSIFNNRFTVPFRLTISNKINVILGKEELPFLTFTYYEDDEESVIDKLELMDALSTGEGKALYLLNIIFEIEVRKAKLQETIFIIDDIADSFDYKNKYAIIQYLNDINENIFFKQIILTHNFDFFRTIEGRGLVKHKCCFMTLKNKEGIQLEPALGIKNIFIKSWKKDFHLNNKIMLASIPFIRNIIEYTIGQNTENYKRLTSLLHWKKDSLLINKEQLLQIFNETFHEDRELNGNNDNVIEMIMQHAKECLDAADGINLENKIILSIAIRLKSEQFMAHKINNFEFNNIDSGQTYNLFSKFKKIMPHEEDKIALLQQVILMTPENIHLNAFMYEPIIDMSDEHLRKLFKNIDNCAITDSVC